MAIGPTYHWSVRPGRDLLHVKYATVAMMMLCRALCLSCKLLVTRVLKQGRNLGATPFHIIFRTS